MRKRNRYYSGYSFGLRERFHRGVLFSILFSLLVSACSLAIPPFPRPEITTFTPPPALPTSTPLPTSTLTPTDTATPTQSPVLVWVPEYIPAILHSSIILPAGYAFAHTPGEAEINFDVSPANVPITSQWVYALVTPFPTITDGVSLEQLQATWRGNPEPPFNESPLLMDQGTLEVFIQIWGDPASDAVKVVDRGELLDHAWTYQPSWAIIPFEELDPRWKVLTLEGQSPIRKDFDPSVYPLTVPFAFTGTVNLAPIEFGIPPTNRDSSRLTTVAMTGVTAMVRATAFAMELQGVTYPGEEVGPLLAEADITHISNEIPFAADCPYPTPISSSLVFCSNPKYIDLLEFVGTDVIELTGDHFMDYGADATIYTLDMYNDYEWPYYGGGVDAEEARQPVLFEHNGNRIAFMGCNVGCQVKTAIPCTAIATDSHPGAAQCDYDWITSEIERLNQEGYQVIFTFQHIEYYKYTAEPILVQDFQRVAQAGATIVNGSQAHQPHGFAFEGDSYLHYGLGNLFFDQFHFCAWYACDDAFIDRHVFYDGRHISTELITIRFVDYAKPRLMTAEERSKFLETMFNASGW